MKATVNKQEFLVALKLASKAVNPNPIIPLTGNILFEVEGDNARLSATNFELGLKTNIAVKKGESFSTALPAKLITDLVNSIQAEEINLSFNTTSQQLTVKTKDSKNNVMCMNADDFPQIGHVSKKNINVSSSMFKEAIGRVSFCSKPPGSGNPVLEGVLIVLEKEKLIMCAVDGFHLSYEEVPVFETNEVKELRTIINANTLETIAKMIDEGQDLLISTTGNQIQFKINDLDITCQTIDGNFPDYKLFKSKKALTNINAQTIPLLRNCKQLELFANEAGKSKFDITGLLIEFSTSSQEKGDSKIQIAANISGDPMAVGINVFMLREFLEVCKTENVLIDFSAPNDPILLRMENIDTFYHIIMPIGIE